MMRIKTLRSHDKMHPNDLNYLLNKLNSHVIVRIKCM